HRGQRRGGGGARARGGGGGGARGGGGGGGRGGPWRGASESGAQALVECSEHGIVGAGGAELGAVVRGRLKRDAVAAHAGHNVGLGERPRGEQPHQLGFAQRRRALGAC